MCTGSTDQLVGGSIGTKQHELSKTAYEISVSISFESLTLHCIFIIDHVTVETCTCKTNAEGLSGASQFERFGPIKTESGVAAINRRVMVNWPLV